MSNYFTDYISTDIEISQSLFLFLILYLFYNVDLLKILINEVLNLVATEYIDDVNVTITDDDLEKNNRKLAILNTRTIN